MTAGKDRQFITINTKKMPVVKPTNIAIRIYTAIISQTGTAAPVAIVLHNTLNGNITWVRDGVGSYRATSNYATEFLTNTTAVLTMSKTNNRILRAYRTANDEITVKNDDLAGAAADTIEALTVIEIRVYTNE